MYFKRTLGGDLRKLLDGFPVLTITGPRQSGKTTMLQEYLPEYRYVNCEDIDIKDFIQSDLKGFLDEYDDKVIFDEAQSAPQLFPQIKVKVDKSKKMGQYILSGSQNFEMMERITESLAGRVSIVKLLPLDNTELKAIGHLPDDLIEVMLKGSYPALFTRPIESGRYYKDYFTTYVKRDISSMVNIRDYALFTNFVRLCSHRAGQLLNLSDLARDAKISHTTAENWISLLETSFIVFRLEPYYENLSKRLIKSSKLYFYDTGLLAHLMGFKKGNISRSNSYFGNLFENFIVAEMIKRNEHECQLRDYYFWRDSLGHEIDLLYFENETYHTFEIKSGITITSKMAVELNYFGNLIDEKFGITKTVIYGGDTTQNRSDFKVVPWKRL